MTPYNEALPILVAIDFSADSETALIWANNYSKCTNSRIIILHVVHDPADAPGFYLNETNHWSKPMVSAAKNMSDDFMNKMYEKHPSLSNIHEAEVVLLQGLPPGRIIEYSEKMKAQIIVLGSCGRTGLQYILLGSVAERVAQLSKVPVVIVKTPVKEDLIDE